MLKKGFTLIELLAVIVILGVISTIAVPTITHYIKQTKESSFLNSVNSAMSSVGTYLMNNKFPTLPAEGVNIADLDLSNKEQFTGGKIILSTSGEYKAVAVTNGTFCVTGTRGNFIIGDDCISLDTTAPTLDETKIVITTTTNSVGVTVPSNAIIEEESNIVSYTYELLNGATTVATNTSATNTYTFNNLTSETSYTVKVTITNENSLTATKSVAAITESITTPTYSVNPTSGYATSKTVTVNFPNRQTGFIFQYSLNGGTSWTDVAGGTPTTPTSTNVVFNANGNIIARVYDGTNYKTASSLAISGIDTTIPTITNSVATATVTLTVTDNLSGVSSYCVNTSNTSVGCTWTGITNTLNGTATYTATVAGTYYAFSRDAVLNISNSSSFTIAASAFCAYTAGQVVQTFNATGAIQTLTIPCDGTYKLEVYGAQGGNTTASNGGYGGYSVGYKTFTKNTVIYIGVGSQGVAATVTSSTNAGGYNGGGAGYFWSGFGAGGGGLTHIAKVTGTLASIGYSSAITSGNLLIAAGGGGGAGNWDGVYKGYGGTGGGATGGNGSIVGGSSRVPGKGATQSAGGDGDGTCDGTFGAGANHSGGTGLQTGGGGGLYGGGAGSCEAGAGGGSGYIGGVTSGSMSSGVRSGNGTAIITKFD